jgi:Family of unknown function (DUF6481)
LTAYRDKGFSERLNTAADARRATLERFRAKPGPDDPAVIERRAARQAISAAREARVAARQAALEAEAARQAAREVEAAREAEAARQAAEQADHDGALEAADRKAARDARYAARKARR